MLPIFWSGLAGFHEHSAGMAWELASIEFYLFSSYGYLGRIRLLSELVPKSLSDALDRGDLYCTANLRLGQMTFAWLAGGGLQEARRVASEASASLETEGFHVQHWSELSTRVHLDLFEGNGKQAWDYVVKRWPALRRSLLLRIEVVP
jgi:hypothetical protein